MSTDLPPPPASSVRPRIRVYHDEEIALGPGKVNLLEAIERTGSLAEAARSLGISYMRAWHLLQTMNACFKEPLVHSSRGGTKHGGAALTETGRAVVAAYRRMEADSLRALEPAWQEILRLLAP
jgi:molybdate transport system regulatory protein